jgi:hypothetical protein
MSAVLNGPEAEMHKSFCEAYLFKFDPPLGVACLLAAVFMHWLRRRVANRPSCFGRAGARSFVRCKSRFPFCIPPSSRLVPLSFPFGGIAKRLKGG